MNTTASIYIPRMSTFWNENGIKHIMNKYEIGTVSRVDFTPINKKPGFVEKHTDGYISAFVHFSDPILSTDRKYYSITGSSIGDFWENIRNGQPNKVYVSKTEFWLCLRNNNPVPRTLMNIHQVVENGRHLENLVTEQANEIKNLKETVADLHNTLKGVHNVVYQLVGGLYCQRNQESMVHLHLKHLWFGNEDTTVEDDTYPYGIWPTTRQGDENTERIEKLERIIKEMLHFSEDDMNAKFKENDTLSETSDYSSDISERMKNSYDLCGNA